MTTITGIITNIQKIVDLLVPLVFAVAFIVFIFGVFRYFILGGGNEEKRAQGRQLIMWGIIAFVVMVSVWGLVNVITGTLNFGSTTRPNLPTFSGSSGSTQTPTQTPVPAQTPQTPQTPTPPPAFIGPMND